MEEPCRSCPEKEKDFGGCRCQAYMMTGNAAAADPVCDKSPHHADLQAEVGLIEKTSANKNEPLIFRTMKNSKKYQADKKLNLSQN